MERAFDEEGSMVRESPKKLFGLKKEKKENWGRFLDNHYHDDVHSRPFVFQKKVPDGVYKYSHSGLSHLYPKKNILEKLDAEKQGSSLKEERKYGEYQTLKEGDSLVVIEHCANCKNHLTSTKHIEEKYLAFARRIKQAINQKFPGLRVALKPISTSDDEKTHRIFFKPGSKTCGDNIIDAQKTEPRLGAFEVTLASREKGKLSTKLLFSKLNSNVWPSVAAVLKKVYDLMPKTRVVVTAYDLDTGEKENLEGLRVKLVQRFKDSEAQRELDKEL